jgi:hypothetical protein
MACTEQAKTIPPADQTACRPVVVGRQGRIPDFDCLHAGRLLAAERLIRIRFTSSGFHRCQEPRVE